MQLVTEFAAILISITAILTFGEILPQAICARHGLAIGAYLAWPVRTLMFICSPIAWPVGKLLDWMLPHEDYSFFRRGQLKVALCN
jgi:metal transporter CNNM